MPCCRVGAWGGGGRHDDHRRHRDGWAVCPVPLGGGASCTIGSRPPRAAQQGCPVHGTDDGAARSSVWWRWRWRRQQPQWGCLRTRRAEPAAVMAARPPSPARGARLSAVRGALRCGSWRSGSGGQSGGVRGYVTPHPPGPGWLVAVGGWLLPPSTVGGAPRQTPMAALFPSVGRGRGGRACRRPSPPRGRAVAVVIGGIAVGLAVGGVLATKARRSEAARRRWGEAVDDAPN